MTRLSLAGFEPMSDGKSCTLWQCQHKRSCRHLFHLNCAQQVLTSRPVQCNCVNHRAKCPCCRAPFTQAKPLPNVHAYPAEWLRHIAAVDATGPCGTETKQWVSDEEILGSLAARFPLNEEFNRELKRRVASLPSVAGQAQNTVTFSGFMDATVGVLPLIRERLQAEPATQSTSIDRACEILRQNNIPVPPELEGDLSAPSSSLSQSIQRSRAAERIERMLDLVQLVLAHRRQGEAAALEQAIAASLPSYPHDARAQAENAETSSSALPPAASSSAAPPARAPPVFLMAAAARDPQEEEPEEALRQLLLMGKQVQAMQAEGAGLQKKTKSLWKRVKASLTGRR